MVVFIFAFLLVIIIFQAVYSHDITAKLRFEREQRHRANQRYDDLAGRYDELVTDNQNRKYFHREVMRQTRRIEAAVATIFDPKFRS